MAELARFFGIVVSVFFRDFGRHRRPHVHVDYAEHAASIAIDDGTVLDGHLPRPELHLVRQWLSRHRAETREAWEFAKAGKTPNKIQTYSKKGKR